MPRFVNRRGAVSKKHFDTKLIADCYKVPRVLVAGTSTIARIFCPEDVNREIRITYKLIFPRCRVF